MQMSEVQSIDRNTSADEAMTILGRDGVVVYKNLLEDETMDQIRSELDAYVGRAYHGEGEFWGFKTKRFGALVTKSRTFAEQCAPNPQVLAVMDQLLGPRCERYQLHVTMLVQIGPNESPQIMHRDDGLMPFTHPGPQTLCNTMWALSDFTEENGATNVILGSHKWSDDRTPKASDEIVQAVMPKGSCLIYVGSVWHGGGANRSQETWRTGMICGYSLGWLRQEENMYLAVPPAVAKELPEHVQHLIGYKIHGGFLGWVEGQDPHVVLEEHYSDVMPAVAEGGEATEDTKIFKTASLGEPSWIDLA
jgi:ectoine hydroxylase-related dioxygenase (phytanoyl-CoA dioxygenase family)